MSKYAFDLDGTLDMPAIAQMARDLHKAGHEIHVVTGAVTDTGLWTLKARQEKLAKLQVPYTKIWRCFGQSLKQIGLEKAKALRQIPVDFIIDDDPDFVDAIRSQGIMCLFVVRK